MLIRIDTGSYLSSSAPKARASRNTNDNDSGDDEACARQKPGCEQLTCIKVPCVRAGVDDVSVSNANNSVLSFHQAFGDLSSTSTLRLRDQLCYFMSMNTVQFLTTEERNGIITRSYENLKRHHWFVHKDMAVLMLRKAYDTLYHEYCMQLISDYILFVTALHRYR